MVLSLSSSLAMSAGEQNDLSGKSEHKSEQHDVNVNLTSSSSNVTEGVVLPSRGDAKPEGPNESELAAEAQRAANASAEAHAKVQQRAEDFVAQYRVKAEQMSGEARQANQELIAALEKSEKENAEFRLREAALVAAKAAATPLSASAAPYEPRMPIESQPVADSLVARSRSRDMRQLRNTRMHNLHPDPEEYEQWKQRSSEMGDVNSGYVNSYVNQHLDQVRQYVMNAEVISGRKWGSTTQKTYRTGSQRYCQAKHELL